MTVKTMFFSFVSVASRAGQSRSFAGCGPPVSCGQGAAYEARFRSWPPNKWPELHIGITYLKDDVTEGELLLIKLVNKLVNTLLLM